MARQTKIDCCYNCPDRVADPNCHGYCEKYLIQRAELDVANKERQKQSRLVQDITGTLVDGARRARKRSRRRKTDG